MVFSLMAGDAQRGEWGFQLKVDICGQGESRARQNVNIRLISRTLIKTVKITGNVTVNQKIFA